MKKKLRKVTMMTPAKRDLLKRMRAGGKEFKFANAEERSLGEKIINDLVNRSMGKDAVDAVEAGSILLELACGPPPEMETQNETFDR